MAGILPDLPEVQWCTRELCVMRRPSLEQRLSDCYLQRVEKLKKEQERVIVILSSELENENLEAASFRAQAPRCAVLHCETERLQNVVHEQFARILQNYPDIAVNQKRIDYLRRVIVLRHPAGSLTFFER